MSDFQLYITLEELQEYADQLLTHAMSLPNSIETHTTSITSTTSPTYNEPHPPPVKTVALPLTPPYKPSKPRRAHPYQRPCNKKRLGLVSPKD
jgi:hypothetical protein